MTEDEGTPLEFTEELPPELSKTQELEEEVGKLKDQLLRTLAELENYRKRAEREREDMAKFAITGFAHELLSVADNLRRAIESVPETDADAEKLLKTLLEGVKITESQLLSIFKKHHIEKIDPMGKAFDHHLHQSMFDVEDSNQPAGTVVQVLQSGYTLHGRLLRPALVGVAKGKKEENNAGEGLEIF
jgi:molecular chaperone GrpE